MAQPPNSLAVIDANSNPQYARVTQNSDGSYTPTTSDVGAIAMLGTIAANTAPSYTGAAPSGNLTLANAGASQLLNGPSQDDLLITNPSTAAGQGISVTESIWYNFTGNAAVIAGGGQSHELLPGASIIIPGPLTTSVNWTAATVGHKISATVV